MGLGGLLGGGVLSAAPVGEVEGFRGAWRRLLVGEELRAAAGARAGVCGRGRRRARERVRGRRAGGSRRGRTVASGWEETRDKVDKVGLGQL